MPSSRKGISGMRISLNEITLPTIQGEGVWIGRPSIFVRVQGCSVRCAQCDTKKSWEPIGAKPGLGTSMTLGEIQKILQSHPHVDIVITGGEPLDSIHVAGVAALCYVMKHHDRRIAIETSAMVPTPDLMRLEELTRHVDLWSISPKLSGMRPTSQATLNIELLRTITSACAHRTTQLKFVVDVRHWERDIAEVRSIVRRSLNWTGPLILQPMTRPNDGTTAILDAWAKLAKAALATPWLLKLRPQILPQAHKLVGMV